MSPDQARPQFYDSGVPEILSSTSTLADIAAAVHQEVIDPGFDLLSIEREELNRINPVLYSVVTDSFVDTINGKMEGDGPEKAQALLHGCLYGHRVIRKFAEAKDKTLPRFPDMFTVLRIMEAMPERKSEQNLDPLTQRPCEAKVFFDGFKHDPELIALVKEFKVHAARDGAGLIFMLFRDLLLQ